jgi:hypothetical protein
MNENQVERAMRNMSFSMTTGQFKARTKTVTRRFGWWFLAPGDVVCGVKKSMGLQKGEKIQRLGRIRILSVRREPLNAITDAELALEGLAGMTPASFVAMMCEKNRVLPDEPVNRIEFEYLN